MAKAGPARDLSDVEKRSLIALIQQGEPLPEKHRFVLFEDKREVELVWNGKSALTGAHSQFCKMTPVPLNPG